MNRNDDQGFPEDHPLHRHVQVFNEPDEEYRRSVAREPGENGRPKGPPQMARDIEIHGYELLVYGECRCGWRLACPEGAHWPHCPQCGLRTAPSLTRDKKRLAYVAQLNLEDDVVDHPLIVTQNVTILPSPEDSDG